MDLARERAVMNAVGRLTEADLETAGVVASFKERANKIEIEDIDYAEASCVERSDGTFECEGIVFFSSDGISDSKPFQVAGRFDGDEVSILSLRPFGAAAHISLAAAA